MWNFGSKRWFQVLLARGKEEPIEVARRNEEAAAVNGFLKASRNMVKHLTDGKINNLNRIKSV